MLFVFEPPFSNTGVPPLNCRPVVFLEMVFFVSIIIDSPACDYLTLTSYDSVPASWMWRFFASYKNTGDMRDAQVMQYRGKSRGSMFSGRGEQRSRPHYMLRCSGSDSDYLLSSALETRLSASCSRIDIQLTLPLPASYSAREFVDVLRAASPEGWGGRPRNVQLIDSSNGLDTVYVGSRQSQTFIRLYVKLADSDFSALDLDSPDKCLDTAYLRFEVEFKGKRARRVYSKLMAGSSLFALLSYEWFRLPVDARLLLSCFDSYFSSDAPPVGSSKDIREPDTTFRWFLSAVVPSLRRLLNDHDYGDYVARVLIDLLGDFI